jgi:lipopolysaccharide transport system ATP-binding protein
MGEYVITAEGLGKRYQIRRAKKRRMFRDVITESALGSFDLLRFLRRRGADAVPPNQDIWALKDANLRFQAGESIGIIGINGSGKSTLLKLLSRITAPTAGRFKIKGRVGSLLEVGTGFHSELTGRENVYLNGAILGMKRSEIDRKFDEIVAFSEIGEYLDAPAKFYSSGMRMRLAFSVAAHLEPEILLIDEVLAVGDVAFQRKSLNKMNEVVGQGRTVLFVSHNMPAVRSMCQRTILLDKGHILTDGSTDAVIRHYLDLNEGRLGGSSYTGEETARGSRVISATVLDGERTPSSYLAHDKPAFVRLELQLIGGHSHVYITMRLYNQDQETVLASYDFDADQAHLQEREPGRYTYDVQLPGNLLTPGLYTLGFEIARLSKKLGTSPRKEVHRIDHICRFEVYDGGSALARLGLQWEGVLHPPIRWKLIAGPGTGGERRPNGL